MRTTLRVMLLALTMALCLIGFSNLPAQAANDCGSNGCIGLDPAKTVCVQSARTVMAMDVQGDGMLELRYSDRCKTNWARFSVYTRANLFGIATGSAISGASLYIWNPNGSLHGVVQGTRWWTEMVDGNAIACTGVELIAQDRSKGGMYSDFVPQGWVGNLCG